MCYCRCRRLLSFRQLNRKTARSISHAWDPHLPLVSSPSLNHSHLGSVVANLNGSNLWCNPVGRLFGIYFATIDDRSQDGCALTRSLQVCCRPNAQVAQSWGTRSWVFDEHMFARALLCYAGKRQAGRSLVGRSEHSAAKRKPWPKAGPAAASRKYQSRYFRTGLCD